MYQEYQQAYAQFQQQQAAKNATHQQQMGQYGHNHNNNNNNNSNNRNHHNQTQQNMQQHTNNNNRNNHQNQTHYNNNNNNNNNRNGYHKNQQRQYNNNNRNRYQNNKRNSNNNNNNNNNNTESKYGNKSPAEYVKHLIKTVREQTEEINCMQYQISQLQKKMKLKNKLEEDFYSFLSRIEFPSWVSDEQKRLCLNKLFENETQKIDQELEEAKVNRRQAASKNLMLETQIIELTDDLSALREYLEQEKHKNYLESVNHNKILAAKLAKNGIDPQQHQHQHQHNNRRNNKYNNHHSNNHHHRSMRSTMDYPPENIIIQNLIRTQIEFYFSDYNLKRDKRLLDQLCSDRIGFLKIDSVMNLTRVRQLSSHRNQVINSLKHSKFLSLTQDNEWVGRLGFERPQEKQFPFRRTVFVFGLPMNCKEKYVTEMLSPFGKLSKVKFDHGPDTLDRLVAENMFKEIKVYKYRELNTKILYNYKQEIMVGGSPEYNCNKCQKIKQCDEGFYETNSYQTLICLQCAAASAETILEKCKNNACNKRMIELLCGKSPRNTQDTKTALAVFTSQRQASKCVYVRSRIAFDGCFTTHYHHYSKLKKEIALTLQPYADKLREIPPRRVLQVYAAQPLITQQQQQQQQQQPVSSIYHLACKPLGAEEFDQIIAAAAPAPIFDNDDIKHDNNNNNNDNEKVSSDESELEAMVKNMPKIAICRTVPVLSTNNSNQSKDDDEIKSASSSSKNSGLETGEIINGPPKLINNYASDNNKFRSPRLKKSSAGSMTAPVVGGSGDLYIMRRAYDKVNNKDAVSTIKNNNSSTQESFVDDSNTNKQ